MATGSCSAERRKAVTHAIQNAPFRFPYADYDEARRITPLQARYDICMDAAEEDTLKENGLPSDYLPPIMTARFMAASYVSSYAEEHGIMMTEISNLCSIDRTLLSKYASRERPVALEAWQLVPLCRAVMRQSCHRVMFGEEGKIVLTGIVSAALEHYETRPAGIRQQISDAVSQLKTRFDLMNPAAGAGGTRRSPEELLRDRARELVYASGRNAEDLFGEPQPRRLKNNTRALFENAESAGLRMPFVMYMAFETGLALDYFIAESFAEYVPCYYTDADGREREITSGDAKKLVDCLFGVTPEVRADMLARILIS